MNGLLGVSKNRSRQPLKPGEESFWCVYNNKLCSIGDYIFLYYTLVGIEQVYIITATSDIPDELGCEFRSMKTVRMKLLKKLDTPITLKQIKSHPVLKNMAAVGRNFQLTTFSIRPTEIEVLLELFNIQH